MCTYRRWLHLNDKYYDKKLCDIADFNSLPLCDDPRSWATLVRAICFLRMFASARASRLVGDAPLAYVPCEAMRVGALRLFNV
jgi:hypothetical protein